MNQEQVTKFKPDYKTPCENCGQTPTVRIVNLQGSTVSRTDMCGPCTFGSAACLDPEEWN